MEEVLYIPLVPQEIWLNLYRAFEFHKEKFREIAISESIDLRFYNLLLQSFGISNNQEMTNVFIVASHGQTATKWFAKALDLHPQINCSHGYYYPPIAANDPRSDLPVAEQRRVTEERFFKRPEGLSLKEYFNELNELGGDQPSDPPVFKGSVHSFTAAMIFNQLRTDPVDGFMWMNMVRHPIDRINSVVAHWSNILEGDERFRKHLFYSDFPRCRHLVDSINAHYDVNLGTVKNTLFVVALLQLEDINSDLKACVDHHIPLIVQERLVSERNYFHGIAVQLTQNQIEISNDYLDRVFAMPKVNTHQTRANKWVDWQKYGFGLVMTEDVQQLYHVLGYTDPLTKFSNRAKQGHAARRH